MTGQTTLRLRRCQLRERDGDGWTTPAGEAWLGDQMMTELVGCYAFRKSKLNHQAGISGEASWQRVCQVKCDLICGDFANERVPRCRHGATSVKTEFTIED